MSVMEKRLQLLLDQARYGLVADEAQRSGRSVAAVIREAIDVRFGPESEQDRRDALRSFLEQTAPPAEGTAAEWAEVKEDLDRDLEEYLDAKTR